MDKTGFEQVKSDLHRSLLAQLDLEKRSAATNGSAKQAVAALIVEILAKEKILLNAAEKDRLQAELLDEGFGLGALEVLLGDPTISDIMVNGKDQVSEPSCDGSGPRSPGAATRLLRSLLRMPTT